MTPFPATQAKIDWLYESFLRSFDEDTLNRLAAAEAEHWEYRYDIERMHLEDIEEAWYGDDQAAVERDMEQYRLYHPELYAEFFHVIDPATRGSKIEKYVPDPNAEVMSSEDVDLWIAEMGWTCVEPDRSLEGGE